MTRRADPTEIRARELALAAGVDPDSRIGKPGSERGMPAWCGFREAARDGKRITSVAGTPIPIRMWTEGVPVEEGAIEQLKNMAQLPFMFHHLAVMPDVHVGKGATVGSVIATKGAIIPAAVGVDVGCGMAALMTNLTANDLPDSLSEIRSELEACIPVGNASHKELPKNAEKRWYKTLKTNYEKIENKHPKFAPKVSAANQLGTLGGGNHFIELCLDETNTVWVMLHSGSRNIGNRIGQFFITAAKQEMEKLGVNLSDRDLSYLTEGSVLFDDYIEAVGWAQDYAMQNRQTMVDNVLLTLAKFFPQLVTDQIVVNCHHNYVEQETHFGEQVWITRKGAVRARQGDMGIIPGSMGARSYITRGKGNPDSFNSSAHGAGRRMSRTEAKRQFTLEDHIQATVGVECRKDDGVIDETPGAYKNIDHVMQAQIDLVDIAYTLKQVLCIKG
jgi:tRNA-splicing ligase RtcB (3'-phosphate/5'-hydroxy nucleic acid ligase)